MFLVIAYNDVFIFNFKVYNCFNNKSLSDLKKNGMQAEPAVQDDRSNSNYDENDEVRAAVTIVEESEPKNYHQADSTCKEKRAVGRPSGSTVQNKNASKSTLKRRFSEISGFLSTDDALHCVKKKLLSADNWSAAELLKIIKDPEKANKLLEMFHVAETKKPIFDPERALALYTATGLTKNSYNILRFALLMEGVNTFPSYHKVNTIFTSK